MPDVATYAQIIATLFVALSVQAASRAIVWRSSADGDRIYRFHRVIDNLNSVASMVLVWIGLTLALMALVVDCLIMSGDSRWSYLSEGGFVGEFNAIVIGGLALVVLLSLPFRLNVKDD